MSQLDVAQTIGMTSVTFYTNAENIKLYLSLFRRGNVFACFAS